jgi:protein phosphatase
MQCDVAVVACSQASFSVPAFDPEDVISLCQDSETVFASEPVVLDLHPPITVVGDLHGQILDLYRIIQQHGLPNRTQYLFLGDFVDRGEFSFEVVTFVFLAKLLFPTQVWVIRGNHEFGYICSTGGFRAELAHLFRTDQVFACFCATFAQMPLAAVLDGSVLAVHGGIGPELTHVDQLRAVKRPIHEFDEGLVDCILWSDPSDDIATFEPSPRGAGYVFGKTAFNAFSDANGLKFVVRGHECVKEGCAFSFDDRLLTVFSASNYCGTSGNMAAVLIVGAGCAIEVRRFPPLPARARDVVIPPERPASGGVHAQPVAPPKKGRSNSNISRRPDGLLATIPKRAGEGVESGRAPSRERRTAGGGFRFYRPG